MREVNNFLLTPWEEQGGILNLNCTKMIYLYVRMNMKKTLCSPIKTEKNVCLTVNINVTK